MNQNPVVATDMQRSEGNETDGGTGSQQDFLYEIVRGSNTSFYSSTK